MTGIKRRLGSLLGPPGYNATGAAEDQATIAAYITATAGPNPVSDALSNAMQDAITDAEAGIIIPPNVVASNEVARILAVEIGETPATQEGDLVIRYDRPGTHYFTDFTDTPIGEAPTSWEQPWGAFPGGPPTVQAIPDATGGTALVWGTGSGTGANRAVTVWSTIPDNDDSRDVELLVRLRTNVSGGMFPAIVSRVTGDNETGWAIRAGRHSPTTISISRYYDGTYGSSSTIPAPELEADTWYMMRYRGDGEIHSFKMWDETHDEPDWMQTTTNRANVNPGKVGFMFHGGAARVEIDWVAVASAGRRAAP